MGTGPIAGIPLFLGSTFTYFVISSVVFIVALVLTPTIGFEDIPEKTQKATEDLAIAEVTANQEIVSPITGEIVKLEDVNDNVFAMKMMGDGIAIRPTVGKVVAPFDGVVASVVKSKHAIILKSNDGCELLIHIGLIPLSLKERVI